MKYFSICSLFPLELFNEEKCFAFPAALGFLLLYKSSTTERQWEDDSLWEPLFVQMMDSMNSNGNFLVLWASAWILTENHPVGWERCSSPLLIYSPASLPHLMRSDEFPCSLFSCTLETGWLSVITFLYRSQGSGSSNGHCMREWAQVSSTSEQFLPSCGCLENSAIKSHWRNQTFQLSVFFLNF